MILKGSQRAGGKALALHLLRQDENDHIEIHEVRGFVSRNLIGAFKEAYAVSRGSRCKQFLFSLSLSPPSDKSVSVETFEQGIAKVEARLGLTGLPRAIVFHEKKGRRHAHCVWSRIDPKTMRARQLSHFKLRLVELSRELYLEHGWTLPHGLAKSRPRNPLNFSLAEWQQAKRADRDPANLKAMFKECWAVSDSAQAFRNALESRGYYLARGDRRGFVAVDWKGEVFSISRWCGIPTKVIDDRLKNFPLPDVDTAREAIRARVAAKLSEFVADIRLQFDKARQSLANKRAAMVSEQRLQRRQLDVRQAQRWQREEIERAGRLRRGLLGLWDWLTGRRARTLIENGREVLAARRRDEAERQKLIEEHLKRSRTLQQEIASLERRSRAEEERLLTSPRGAPSPARLERARRPRPHLERDGRGRSKRPAEP